MTEADARLWSKDFVLAMVVNFFVGLVFYGLMTTLALYAVERFGAGESAAGLAASARSSSVRSSPPWGSEPSTRCWLPSAFSRPASTT